MAYKGLFCNIGSQALVGLKYIKYFVNSRKGCTFALSKGKDNNIQQH